MAGALEGAPAVNGQVVMSSRIKLDLLCLFLELRWKDVEVHTN